MKVQVEDIGPVKKQVQVSIPDDRVARVHGQVVRDVSRRAKIPGFRPGKVPRSILEKYYSHEIEKDMTSRLVSDTFQEVLDSQGIEAVASPTLEKSERISDSGFGFRYTLAVEVKPSFEPGNYMGLKVERPVQNVSEEDVEAELARLREQHALLRTIDEERPIRKGDFVVIDIQGKVDGKTFEGGNSENFLVEVGAGRLLPGLEDGLIGLRSHSTSEITVPLPPDFEKPQLAGKSAVFAIHVKELKEKILPDLDDEFAKEVGGFETLKEIRAKIREDLQKLADSAADEVVREAILARLLQDNPLELPPSMVEEEARLIHKNLKLRLMSQGANAETAGLGEQDILTRCMDAAKERVHANLILEVIAQKEGLSVADEEVDEEIRNIARRSGITVERLKESLQKKGAMGSLRSRLLEDKTLDFLKEKATIKTVKKALNIETGR
ncbi:MAG: trigger factor [Deltaproteobacteria bacterium]|nr:trigger factor [Deltaproteobacteria bacterium]